MRETAEAAWREADALIQHVDDETIAFSQRTFAHFDSVGQQRMARLHNERRDRLEISPNLWGASGLCAEVPGWRFVNPEQVAARMREYTAIGIDRFILSGNSRLEERYRVAELVFPLLPLKPATGHDRGPARNAGPFGEIIANVVAPAALHRNR